MDFRFNLKRTGTSDGNQEKKVGIADGNPGNWIFLQVIHRAVKTHNQASGNMAGY